MAQSPPVMVGNQTYQSLTATTQNPSAVYMDIKANKKKDSKKASEFSPVTAPTPSPSQGNNSADFYQLVNPGKKEGRNTYEVSTH